jgi:hypothetical protein
MVNGDASVSKAPRRSFHRIRRLAQLALVALHPPVALVTEPLPNPAVGLIGMALTGLRSPGWRQFTPTNNARSAGIVFQ